MRVRGKTTGLVATGIVVAIVATFVINLPISSQATGGNGLFLVKPAFAQAAEAGFLEQEAGITAYVNVGQTIDPSRAKSAFNTVERETESYIIGSVTDIHVYVHQDGWVVAYYLRGEPTSKIFGEQYGKSAGNQNKLKDALGTVSSLMGVAPTAVNYYHFQYPGANKLMKIVGTEFRVKIPNEFIVFEASKLYWTWGVTFSMRYAGYSKIDIPPNDTFVTVSYRGGGAMVLVYREP